LIGATGMEELNLGGLKTTNITLPVKSNWNTLKRLSIDRSVVGKFNYDNSINYDYLDLKHFESLEYINLGFNEKV
jgi:hypothetical protein